MGSLPLANKVEVWTHQPLRLNALIPCWATNLTQKPKLLGNRTTMHIEPTRLKPSIVIILFEIYLVQKIRHQGLPITTTAIGIINIGFFCEPLFYIIYHFSLSFHLLILWSSHKISKAYMAKLNLMTSLLSATSPLPPQSPVIWACLRRVD